MKIKIRWMSKSKLRIFTCLALSMIILFYLINNAYFIINDKIFPDSAIGLMYHCTLNMYNYIQNFEFKKAFLFSSHYPPLFNLVSIPFLFIFGKNHNYANLANLVFLVVLILSVYGIAKEYKNHFAGYLSVLILLSFPQIIGLSRVYTLDFALTALVCLSVYYLIKTENFIKRKESMIFGVILSLGMLTKWTFLFFIIGPLTYTGITIFKNKNIKLRLTNLSTSAIIGIVISLSWYLYKFSNFFPMLSQVSIANSGNSIVNPNFLNFILGFIKILILQQVYYVFFFIFIICFAYILIYKRNYLLFIIWFLTPLFIFSLLQSNCICGRYLLSYLPSVAIIISLSTFDIKKVVLRRTSIVMLSVLAVALFLLFSYSASFGKNLVSDTSNSRTQHGYLKYTF